MPNPCAPFAFCDCYGPYLVEIRITLPPGYQDRTVNEGSGGWPGRYSELERTLATAYDQHPTRMLVRQHGGESHVDCGATRVYRKPADTSHPPTVAFTPPDAMPPAAVPAPASDNVWLVETYLYAPTLPVGYRQRVAELPRQWLGTLTTIPLPNSAGDITVEVLNTAGAAMEAWT